MARQTPRVILRTPRRGRFGEDDVLVLEMGLGGAKFEHTIRLDVGRQATFNCGPLTTEAEVRHSVLLPAQSGVVYQSGVSFPQIGPRENELLLGLLVHEAQEQVIEWESNLQGVERPPQSTRRARQSAVAVRYVRLLKTMRGWEEKITSDPNQPIDGVTVLEGTPDEELAVLKKTYDDADVETRELMRRMATVAILEQMRG